MDLQLSGHAAIVTGASRGLGAAIARQLAREGVSVVVNYSRDRVGSDSVCAEIDAAGGRAVAFQSDVADPPAAGRLVEYAIAQFGRLDILVNNAGAVARTPFLQASQEEFDRVINTNLRGTWNCSQAAARRMMERRYGRILNCSSVSSFMPVLGHAAYSASKAAIEALTRVMAGELAPYNILVNAYVPGSFDTPVLKPAMEKRGDELLGSIGLRRLGQPEEIARLVAFLASPLNSYMSGSAVLVHGAKLSLQNPMKPWLEPAPDS